MREVLAVGAIELPQDAGLAGAEHRLLAVDVNQHALEDLVEIERLGGRVLEVPRELAGVGIEREGRPGIENPVGDRRAAVALSATGG